MASLGQPLGGAPPCESPELSTGYHVGNTEVFEIMDVRALPYAGSLLASSCCSCIVRRKAFNDQAKLRILEIL